MVAVPVAASSETVELTILGTTDIHGHIFPTSYLKQGQEEALGLAKIATLVKLERAAHPNVLLVDSGDLLQGSPMTDWFAHLGDPTRGINPLVAVMNAMSYDALAVGNHDFDYGLDFLLKARKDAKFPFLSANAYKAGTTSPLFDPYSIREIAGIRVGIIGATTPGTALSNKKQVEGKVDFGDIVEAFRTHVPLLKGKDVDVIVGIPHSGYGGDGAFGPTFSGYSDEAGLPQEQVGFRLAREFPDLDVLLLGHSHQALSSEVEGDRTVIKGTINGKPAGDTVPRPIAVAQANMWGMGLAVARLTLTRKGERWVVTGRKAELLSTRDIPADPGILALTGNHHEATLRFVNAPIANTPEPWDARNSRLQDTPLVDLINKIQLERTQAQLSSAACFDPDAGLSKGAISIAQVAAIYPFDNTLVAVRITGKQLRAYLERSASYFAPYVAGGEAIDPKRAGYNYDMLAGADYAIDVTKPAGSRITTLSVGGTPVTDGHSFTLALNSYRQQGGGGFEMFRDAPAIYNRDESIRTVIIEYLVRNQTIKPADVFEENWRLLPVGAIDAATRLYR